MVQYYIDSDNGLDTADGLSISGDATNGPWKTMHKFTEAASSAGDIATCRRGTTATYSDGGNLEFTSDGASSAPIKLEADYDDYWSDQVDLSATATATLTFGSPTITFSADVSGVLAAGDWIYASGDNNRDFAYEVKTVATVTVTLYLPYKGDQAGATKTMFNMQSAPIWQTTPAAFYVDVNTDIGWAFQGLVFKSTADQCFSVTNSRTCTLVDMYMDNSGSFKRGIQLAANAGFFSTHMAKCRFLTTFDCITLGAGSGMAGTIQDCLFDDTGVTGSGIAPQGGSSLLISECDFSQMTAADFAWSSGNAAAYLNLRNCLSQGGVSAGVDGVIGSGIFMEDQNQVIGDSQRLDGLGDTNNVSVTRSETTKVRAGGATTSIKVTPSANMNDLWQLGRLQILELPIYATTASKTYTFFFASDTITEWTTGPTAGELWVEFEAYGHATNKARKVNKSTGTVDFTTDTDFDQSIAVTVAPGQAGIGYLRVWYTKTKEAGKTNVFYVDPIPTVA